MPQPKKPAARRKTAKELTIPRVFTTEGVHPYDEVDWETRDVVQTNWKTGETVFEQREVEVPRHWSVNAATIAVTKYFRGSLSTDRRETSVKQLIDRVVDTYTEQGAAAGYFATTADAEVFSHELKHALVNQMFAFNSPVWFNVGWEGRDPQVSACFILGVEDSMESILNWYTEEGLIFKGGSGAGINLSKIRSSKEHLSSGGTASGPVSFMRGADASAGTIKSGGAVRRAAKMVVLDVDHPDIEEFIETKAREEDKIRVLRDAGFDMDLGGRDMNSVQYQNANNSVRVDDLFMYAVENDLRYGLRPRSDNPGVELDEDGFVETVSARELWGKIAQAAWECADPGVQYSDTINRWHTLKAHSPITTSNPCSEFLSIDNASCNLGSINLMKFRRADGSFDIDGFESMCRLATVAMDISISFGHFPTEKLTENTRRYRQLGLGYANLGALLMSLGLAYDSDAGRELAAAITSLMSAAATHQSATVAKAMGAYHDWKIHAPAHIEVLEMHMAAAYDSGPEHGSNAAVIGEVAHNLWGEAVEAAKKTGLRNSQISLLAPTGTIGFLMDCDTTGIEPDFSLVKFKKLVGGGSMQIVNQTIPMGLETLGYRPEQVEAITAHITEHGHVVGAPELDKAHQAVFDCAVGQRSIAPMGHVLMMSAVQPFLSGAISKTINLPQEATVDDVADIYLQGWKLGLKALAVYRDGCKVGQPLSTTTTEKKIEEPAAPAPVVEPKPARRRLPRQRDARTTSFTVGGAEGYMTSGQYADGGLGEVFLKLGKQGSTLAGVMDAFSIAVSVALQHGVPLETYVSKFTNQKFEPAGMTDDPDVRMAQSILDYVFKRLALDHLDYETRAELGVYTAAERKRFNETGSYLPEEVDELAATDPLDDDVVTHPVTKVAPVSSVAVVEKNLGRPVDAPLCLVCGTKMRPSGSCYACEDCGSTSGCS